MTNSAMVSQADVCLLMTTWLPDGMRSRPSTVNVRPQRWCSIQRLHRAQLRAMANCMRYGRKSKAPCSRPRDRPTPSNTR